jgi:hypothetical protein
VIWHEIASGSVQWSEGRAPAGRAAARAPEEIMRDGHDTMMAATRRGRVGCESETHALALTLLAPSRKILVAALRHAASDPPVMIAEPEVLRSTLKVRVHVSGDELSSAFFPAAVLTASRSLRYPSTSEGGRTTYTVTDGILSP